MAVVDRHIQALRDALVAEHEAYIAEVEGWAHEAQVRGNAEAARHHLAHVDRLKAMPYPWDRQAA